MQTQNSTPPTAPQAPLKARLAPARPKRTMPVQAVALHLKHFLLNQTDGGFSEWFFAACGDDVRYLAEHRQWALWDGRRWMIDAANAIRERAKECVRTIVSMIPYEESPEAQEKMLKLAHRFDNVDRIEKMLKYAQTDPRVLTSIQDYDQNTWLLNVANGTIDLRTGNLLVPLRKHMITKVLDIQYDQHANAPTWKAFLVRIMRSHPDIIPFLQRAVGYTLTAATTEHLFFLLYGSGRNGKSTFVEALLAVLGEYAQASSPETWLKQMGGRSAEPDIARLPGVRMVSTAEIGEGRALDEARVKAIVAGDTITTRNLYQSAFDFVPTCKLWISTNHAPQIKGNDEGMWRRVCLIPFAETISYDEMDRDLPNKLRAELPGILAWAVQGCIDWQRDGMQIPDVVRAKTDEYRSDQDVIGQWIDECCDIDDDARESGSALFASYAEWARARGERRPLNATMFGRRLTDRGIESAKTGGVAWRVGLRLRPADVPNRYGNQDS